MVAASLCKRCLIAAAVLTFTAVPLPAWAHAGGHFGGHGGHAGAVAGTHAPGPAGRVVAGAPHVHGDGFHGRAVSPGFHHGHWIHGVHAGHLGWWWVGAAAPLTVQPVAPAALLVQPQARYWCNVLQAYYPEVLTCPEPWMLVMPAPFPE